MLRLESLENRLALATVNLAGGVLSISAQSGPLTVETTADNKVHVMDSMTDLSFKQGKVDVVRVFDTPIDDTTFVFADQSPAKYDVEYHGLAGTNVVLTSGHFKGNFDYMAGSGSEVLLSTGKFKLNGDLSYTGSTGTNIISFQNFDSVFKGNITINVASSALTLFVISDTAGLNAKYRVKGDVIYQGGAGVDQVIFTTNFSHRMKFHDVTINLGTGGADFFDSLNAVYHHLMVTSS